MKLEEGLEAIKKNGLDSLWQNWQVALENEGQWNMGMLTAFLCRERVNVLKVMDRASYLSLLKDFAKGAGETWMANMYNPAIKKDEVKPPLYYAVFYGARGQMDEADSEMLNIVVESTPKEVMDTKIVFQKRGEEAKESVLSAVLAYGFNDDVIGKVIDKTSHQKMLETALPGASKKVTTKINKRLQALAPKKGTGRWLSAGWGRSQQKVAAPV